MLDVDFIEWRYRNGDLVAVGVMEVTRVDADRNVTDGYLAAIIQRFEERDMQALAARRVAEAVASACWSIKEAVDLRARTARSF